MQNRQKLENEQQYWLEISGKQLKEVQETDEETLVVAETAQEENSMKRKGYYIIEEEWCE